MVQHQMHAGGDILADGKEGQGSDEDMLPRRGTRQDTDAQLRVHMKEMLLKDVLTQISTGTIEERVRLSVQLCWLYIVCLLVASIMNSHSSRGSCYVTARVWVSARYLGDGKCWCWCRLGLWVECEGRV